MKDINQSLELNPKYLKALNRRYKAAEKLQQYRQCVEDITTVCFLEKFSNIDSLTNVDRILKIVGNFFLILNAIVYLLNEGNNLKSLAQ